MSVLYRQAQAAFSLAQVNWPSQPFFAALCTTGYTPNAEHVPADVPSSAVLSQVPMTGLAVVDGALDAADAVFPAVAGTVIVGVLIGRGTSLQDCDLLLAYINGGTLPLVPSGTDVTVVWSDAENKILRL